MTHTVDPQLLERPIRILVVGWQCYRVRTSVPPSVSTRLRTSRTQLLRHGSLSNEMGSPGSAGEAPEV